MVKKLGEKEKKWPTGIVTMEIVYLFLNKK